MDSYRKCGARHNYETVNNSLDRRVDLQTRRSSFVRLIRSEAVDMMALPEGQADTVDKKVETPSMETIEDQGGNAIEPQLLEYVMMFSSLEDQIRLSSVSSTFRSTYKAYRNSIKYFSLHDLVEQLKDIGGMYYASEKWCRYVFGVLLESRIGSIQTVDLSPMRVQLIGHLYDYLRQHAKVTYFVLPQGITSWKDLDCLAELCPRLECLVISSLNADWLFKEEPKFSSYKTIDDAIEDMGVDASKFANLIAVDDKLRQLGKNPGLILFLTVALRKKFPNFRKLIIESFKMRPEVERPTGGGDAKE
uniref:F-box domain-containing protein n=1 Tax=Steinernema glaseri TaxID=37863 RepID=A0A1I8AAK6_9BILA